MSTTQDLIRGINAVEGFDPATLAVDYTDLNTGEQRKRLPVMAQIAWFRLKHPDGRIAISVQAVKDYFVATARVYVHYNDPPENFLAEASAARGKSAEQPTISPREWAQTAAVGIALRNAGFGLQFHAAGEGFDSPAVDELGAGAPAAEEASKPEIVPKLAPEAEPEVLTYEKALLLPCPITKYSGKTLGEVARIDPKALVWVVEKFTGDPKLKEGARLICDRAMQAAA
ncbi:MAG: hypothetical protein FWC27_14650 [Firmicutes bacterium]|nr:hypothetical protein [Bacillota bacterium]